MLEEIKRNLDSIAALCEKHHVQRLELFGSGATNRFDSETSDLDFLVEFQDVPLSESAESYFGLLFGLEDSFGKPVDLVEWSAITNPYFLQAIEQRPRYLVYEARSQETPIRHSTGL